MAATNRLTDRACSAPFVAKLVPDPRTGAQRPRAFEKRSDGEGLFLLVQPDGRKFWRLKYRTNGRERLAGFGEYPSVTLAQARKRRAEYLNAVRDGRDPLADRRAARAAPDAAKVKRERTLEHVATKYHEEISEGFRNPKHRAQWLSSLRPLFAKLGQRDVGEITQRDLIDALRPIFRATPETGRRVRQRIADVFAAAVDDGLINASPAATLRTKKTRKRTGEPKVDHSKHLAALPFAEVPDFVVRLRAYGERLRETGQSLAARYALEFALLTAARTSEVLNAPSTEFADDNSAWRIPGERMKGGEPHDVYLSDPARTILRTMRELTGGGNGYVFPSPTKPGDPLSNMAMLQIMRRLPTGRTRQDGEAEHFGELSTVHGLCRASFSSWAYETAAAREDVIESSLAHRERDRVRGAYSHMAKFVDERRKLMAAWGRYCTSAPREKVVKLDERRRSAKR